MSNPGLGWACQPDACLAWLQATQSPWPLAAEVSPPISTPSTWSVCRIGASHHGVRQTWSRNLMNLARPAGRHLDRASIATSAPEADSAYSRRRVARLPAASVEALAETISRASSAGIGP